MMTGQVGLGLAGEGGDAPRPDVGAEETAALFGAPSAWRLAVLDAILRTLAALGTVALLLTTPVMFLDEQVVLGLSYWAVLGLVLVATFRRSLGYTPRLGALLVLIYVTAVAIVLGEHRVPEFAVYMVTLPVLAALLGGLRWGIGTLVTCAATVLAVAVLAVRHELPPAPDTATNLDHVGNWITLGANWALMAAVVGVSIWFVVARLESSLREARSLAADLERQVEARRDTEQQLLQAQKMEALGQLAGGVAHDFNNLLTVINFGASDALAGDDPHQVRESLAMVLDSATQAEQLVRQLLTFSRRDVAQPRSIAVNELVERTAAVVRRLVPGSVQVETELDPEVGRVFMDDVALRQVLLNLCLNARDAMSDGGGRLCLRTGRRRGAVAGVGGTRLEAAADGAGWVVIEVADDGPGVAPDLRDQIFEPFVTTKPAGKGTGLGLSTSLHIAREAGGTIALETAPGGGASFCVNLPVQTGALVALEHASPPRSLPAGLRILAVDDDPGVRTVLQSALRSTGAIVTVLSSAEAVLRDPTVVERTDVLVTDVVLSGIAGAELVRRVRDQRPELPILYCSGYAPDDQVRAHVHDLGIGFVAKPFSRRTLVDAIARQLEGQAERVAVNGPR